MSLCTAPRVPAPPHVQAAGKGRKQLEQLSLEVCVGSWKLGKHPSAAY